MTCPHYKGRYKSPRALHCENGKQNAVAFHTSEECDRYIAEYCLGKYPDCEDFKKSKEAK